MVMGYRVRIDKIYEVLRMYRRAPRAGWRVLLKPGNLSRWIKWAEKFEERLAKHPNDPQYEVAMKEPWRFSTWNEFEAYMTVGI
jgi:hypothetical protein